MPAVTEPTASAVKREKKRLPWGWGRFGKAIDRLAELLEPGEVIESTAVGVYSQYREQHPFGRFGAGQMNVCIGVTDRRLFLIATTLGGGPLGHDVVEWADLTEFRVDSDKKRSIAVSWPGGALAVDSTAKSAFRDLVAAVGAHAAVR